MPRRFNISVCNERGENQGTPYTQGRVFHSCCGNARRVLFGLCPHLSPVSRLLPCGFWKGIFRAHICGFPFAAMPRGGNFRPLRPAPRLCPVRTRPQRPSRPDFSALYNVFLFSEKSFNLSALPHKWLKTSVYVAEGVDFSTIKEETAEEDDDVLSSVEDPKVQESISSEKPSAAKMRFNRSIVMTEPAPCLVALPISSL